jgi:hypothetical protein
MKKKKKKTLPGLPYETLLDTYIGEGKMSSNKAIEWHLPVD